MASRPGTRELELRHEFRVRRLEVVARALDKLIPGATLVLVVYFGVYRAAHELSGKQTVATLTATLLADTRPNEIIAYVLALVGWIFGVNAQRLRRNTTARLTRRIQQLERQIDPNRTSSGLTPRGQTPPEVS